MPVPTIHKTLAGLIVLANMALWSSSSDVVEYIAGDQPLVFGRYALGRFNSLMICLTVSCVIIYLLWDKRGNFRHRLINVIGMITVLLIGLVAMDTLARWIVTPSYFSNQQSGLQVSDNTYKVTITDCPGAVRSFPRPLPGFPALECIVTMDKRGFRNLSSLDQYDVVTLGDSFTEGFYVSDDHPWPVVLSTASGLSVCNLGISGTGPLMYLMTLKKFGRFLSPKIVICMLTETSDFKTAISDAKRDAFRTELANDTQATHKKDFQSHDPSLANRIESYYHRSPLKIAFNNFCKRDLTRINLHGDIEGVDILSWIPVQIPEGKDAKHYNFTPNRLLDFYIPEKKHLASPGWKTAAFAIKEMQHICRQANIRFVIAYAPNKIHVALPLVKDRLPQDKVLAFAALKSRHKLPPAPVFYENLFQRLSVQENALSDYCKQNGIEYISTTKPLREKIAQGEQVYFTYDTHWTPLGHQVVADVIHQKLFGKTMTN